MADVLLDTHVLLWMVGRDGPRPRRTWAVLQNSENQLYVSAASALEIATKTRLGKLNGGPILASWPRMLARSALVDLPVESSTAIRAGGLGWDHRDPFDRVLVAQALQLGASLLTADRVILDCGLVTTIDARA